jgi:hypothetical protein
MDNSIFKVVITGWFLQEIELARIRQSPAPIVGQEADADENFIASGGDAGGAYKLEDSEDPIEKFRSRLGGMGDAKTCAIFGCGGLAAVIAIVVIAMIVDSAHVIDEGTIGIYFVQGALIDETSMPGVHWAAPFVTEVTEVTIRPQTDTLEPVTVVTRDGIQNTFNDIQGQMSYHSLHLNEMYIQLNIQRPKSWDTT